jgi:hypothetical protein
MKLYVSQLIPFGPQVAFGTHDKNTSTIGYKFGKVVAFAIVVMIW